jgi:RNase P/RNase MRP subunit p30
MTSCNMTSRHMSAHIVSARIMLAHIVALLVSLVAGLRAGQSRMRLCRRLARHGLAAID